jgi:hypothetical protein
MKVQFDEMASWQRGKLHKGQVGEMARWQNGKMLKWQVKVSGKLIERQVIEMTS